MNLIEQYFENAVTFIPAVVAIAGVILVLALARFILDKRYAGRPNSRFQMQLILLVLSFIGLLVIIMSLPLSDTRTGQILSLIGILLSAAIALSSTTFVGNIMAGLMLRAVRSFRPGDFVRIGDHFGRVSEQGLFHTEIQTVDRDLTSMPNLYLVTNPVKVIRSSGTLVTAEVSLGYDISRRKIEKALRQAAADTGLTEPFVHVMELGDFSITYRVAGLLTEVKQLLSCRSMLREKMLDRLHEAGIEIVSPTFMNTRAFDTSQNFIPRAEPRESEESDTRTTPEAVVFDKAEEAESLEKLQERFDALGGELDEARAALKESAEDRAKQDLQARIDRLETSRTRLADFIKRRAESPRKE